jgi:carbamate kinase
MRVVAALGGNALLKRGEAPDAATLARNVRVAADAIAGIAVGNELVITHGNGPQIGLLALQAEAYSTVPPYPLDVLGAETEGMIGYMVERELRNRLPGQEIATLLTQVEVALDDPAFGHPTKPIGPVYDVATARNLAAARGWSIAADVTGFRRVVPSPKPRRILQIDTIRRLIEIRTLVICAGGGGIPVATPEGGETQGVDAVIDKDSSSALLAEALGADMLLLLTDVDGVYEEFGHQDAGKFANTTPEALSSLEFDPGSMGPKVAAACNFVTKTGGIAVIGAMKEASDMLEGNAGTIVRRYPEALETSPPR